MTAFVAILVGLVVGGVTLWIVGSALARRDRAEARLWAASQGVRLDVATLPVVEAYLATSRNLRHIGGVGGVLVAPAVTAGTGIDLQLPWVVWALTGYLVGCLWAELALTRRPRSGHRAASLTARRLTGYLPPTMLRLQVLAPLVVLAMGLTCGWVVDGTAPPDPTAWSLGSDPDVLRRGAVLAGFLAVASAAGILVAQRHIVRRPQPLTDAMHVSVDDALRSSSVRLLGATGIAVVGVLASAQLTYLAAVTDDPWSELPGLASMVVLAASLLQWRWWPHRSWRVRRPLHELPAPPPLVALLDGPKGSDDV